MPPIRLTAILALGIVAMGCTQQSAEKSVASSNPRESAASDGLPAPPHKLPKKLDAEHLPNPWQIHPQVISGGLPEGDVAFEQLAKLGVKTVISVDGAKPDVVLAKKHGLRYVHLPHGYNGISPDRVQELAKAVRDLPGPIYIHCHHGKHRSPTAAAVACVGAGLLDSSRAVEVLNAAGTSDSYRGLYASAREARRFESRLLDELNDDFPETVKLPPLAEAMVALEHTHDHLKEIAASGWKPPAKHPDLDPAHEALLLREHFTEMLRTDAVKKQSGEFQALLRESEASSLQLETALKEWKTGELAGSPPPMAAKAFGEVSARCKSCHTTFRDIPLQAPSAAIP